MLQLVYVVRGPQIRFQPSLLFLRPVTFKFSQIQFLLVLLIVVVFTSAQHPVAHVQTTPLVSHILASLTAVKALQKRRFVRRVFSFSASSCLRGFLAHVEIDFTCISKCLKCKSSL